MLIYTSGTTGRPKGAVHVQAGFPIKGAQDMAHCFDVQADDTLFWLTDLGWPRMVNISGLLPGVTRLGDELDLVRFPGEVDGTPFAAKVDWVWNGTGFAAPGA